MISLPGVPLQTGVFDPQRMLGEAFSCLFFFARGVPDWTGIGLAFSLPGLEPMIHWGGREHVLPAKSEAGLLLRFGDTVCLSGICGQQLTSYSNGKGDVSPRTLAVLKIRNKLIVFLQVQDIEHAESHHGALDAVQNKVTRNNNKNKVSCRALD